MVVAFLQMANERRFLNLSGVVGRSEMTNRTTTIYDIFHTKPMFLFNLDIHGTWLTTDVVAGNPGSYRKSVTAGIPECLQEIGSHNCLQE